MTPSVFSKPKNRWLVGLVAATAVTGGIAIYGFSQFGSVQESSLQPTTSTVQKVMALGRLEPEAEVIELSAPQALDGDRVAQLLIHQGDRVKAGQVVAILDARDRLQNALLEAQKQVKVAQSKLAQVRAGAKSGEIAAQAAQIDRFQAELQGEVKTQKAALARWQSEVNHARAEYNRYQTLYREGAISTSQFDQRQLALETAQAQLDEARANHNRTADSLQAQISEAKSTLDQIAEVRPVDVQAAQTEVDTAIAASKRAQAELAEAYIRSPMPGQILKVHTQPGETISDDGIAELGQTDRMSAIAEVYQTDIGKVRVGQPAVITAQAFPGEVQGTVSEVGLAVLQQKVFSNQPGENLDRRVVEVKIRLNPEASKRVAGLTNLQVQTAIHL